MTVSISLRTSPSDRFEVTETHHLACDGSSDLFVERNQMAGLYLDDQNAVCSMDVLTMGSKAAALATKAPAGSGSQLARTANQRPSKAPDQSEGVRVVSIDSRVTESNSSFWRYAWKMRLANESDTRRAFNGTIEFQDSDGFVVSIDLIASEAIAARSEQDFTGSTLVKADVAGKIARTVGKVRLVR